MTYQEALEVLRTCYKVENVEHLNTSKDLYKAQLEPIDDVIIQVLSKLIELKKPKKPYKKAQDKTNKWAIYCSNCDACLLSNYTSKPRNNNIKFCFQCGQRIDWSEK